MPRPKRIEYPGAVYHVFARGHDRRTIFLDDEDRFTFLSRFEDVASRHGWKVPVYCLMGNHYHLVLETPAANLAIGMRDLNSSYCQRFNQRHGRSGPLLQRRYSAILVEDDEYLADLSRYVLRNPVRAGLCQYPSDWRWSSYRSMIVSSAAPAFLDAASVLALFDRDPTSAQREFAAFVAISERDGIWSPKVSSALSKSLTPTER